MAELNNDLSQIESFQDDTLVRFSAKKFIESGDIHDLVLVTAEETANIATAIEEFVIETVDRDTWENKTELDN